jgi:hypothetical protein
MIRNITAIKGAYIFFQSCLLIILILIPVYFLCSNYVDKYFEKWLVEIDQTAETALRHLLVSFEPVPGLDAEKYHISVIDQKTGEYVYEQGKRADGLGELWERYRTKLIYEMQKQKRGWIFYPEKGSWWVESGQRVIRYVPMDERGWIFALETRKESELAVWKDNLSAKFNLALLSVLTVGPLFFWFLTSNAFAAVQRLMKESIERSLISLSSEDLIGDDLKLGQPVGDAPRKGEPFLPEKETFQDSVSAGSVEQAAFDHKMDVKNYKFELNAPQGHEAQGGRHHPEKDSFSHPLNIVPPQNVVEQKEPPKPERDPNPGPKAEGGNEAALDHLTVNFDNIKSSVLKNMIKRMRKDS